MGKRVKIPFLDLSFQLDPIQEELQGAIDRLFSHKQFILGREVEEFEEALADYLNVPYAIGVASGSDAILLSLMALDLEPASEVITTPFTFFATVTAAVRLGLRVVFADVAPEGFQIDPHEVRRKITSKTRVLLPVHLYGDMAPIDPLMEIAKEFHLTVVEDAAQAFGARIQSEGGGRSAGTIGDFGCYSFFPTKPLGGFGDGGAIVVSDEGRAKRLKALRHHGSFERYHHELLGINSRLDALQAALLRVKLRYVDRWKRERQKIASWYRKEAHDRWDWDCEAGASDRLSPALLPPVSAEVEPVYHQFVIRAVDRDRLKGYLEGRGIPTEIYYPSLVPFQPSLRRLGFSPGDFPQAERLCREVLALPIYPGLSREAVIYIVENIKEFYSKR